MIKDEMSLFLDRYGFRCSNEQKLEENDLTDDPSFAFSNLQSYIKMKTYSVKEMEKKEKLIRTSAETKVKTHLKGLRLIIYFWFLKHTRNAVKNRENLRFARTKSFGLYRRLFREIGVKFKELELIENDKDIFYLYIDEILDSTRGCLPSLEFKVLIEARKKEFERYRQLNDPPERFITYGATSVSFKNPILINNSDLLKDKVRVSDDPNLIYGTSCSPGVVEGIARVVKDIHEAQGIEGEILITYRTDPGWVPLYPSCKGLIIERGSLLSHSAVVARELGLPTIVGVEGDIFKKIKTGDLIRLDATRGEIRININNK
jgi:pyruvate,water dikinase